jgi:hypothetical protein
VLGHWLAYVIAVPRPGLRAELLLESGHSYWSLAIKLAVVLGLAGLGALAIRRLSSGLWEVSSGGELLCWLAVRLVFLQVVVFAGMEVVERVTVGAPIGGMFYHRVFLFGVLVQALVACLGALMLLLCDRTIERAALSLGRGAPARQLNFAVRLRQFPFRPVVQLVGASGVRGPPARSQASA